MYKLDTKKGLKILTVNTGGSKEAVGWALEQTADVIMIQEHRLFDGALASAQLNSISKGWQGVWEQAEHREAWKERWSSDTGETAGANNQRNGKIQQQVAQSHDTVDPQAKNTLGAYLW